MASSEPTSRIAETDSKERKPSVRFFVGSLAVVLGLFLIGILLVRVDLEEFASGLLILACFGLYAVLELGKEDGIKAAAIGHAIYAGLLLAILGLTVLIIAWKVLVFLAQVVLGIDSLF